MSGLYDRLIDELGDDDNGQPAGLTPLDIADLPDPQRQVMFALLRDSRSSSGGVTREALHERFSDFDDLDGVLNELTQNNWLIRQGEAATVRYKVNLRRKRGSTLDGGLWSTLSSRLTDEDKSDKSSDRDQGKDKPGPPVASDW
jgi:hypothetical protein